MKQEQTQVVIYCRVNAEYITNPTKLAQEQENAIREYCNNRNYNVIKVFTDYETEKDTYQPELHKMREYIMDSKIQTHMIICQDYDRISRDLKTLVNLMMKYEKMQINLVSVRHALILQTHLKHD
jgi:DNA invertase Pin-like site-specific DNA recombinase